jgi:hypothetical protein
MIGLAQFVIAESQDGGSLWLLAIGPAGGAGLYWLLYRFYRNTDKSHSYERETHITAGPVTGDDTKVDEIKGTKKTAISGRNEQQFRKRVQRVP